jgi:hypothetical protein
MADIAAFPTVRNVLISGDNIISYTAVAAVKAGQVVAFNATGVSDTVQACAVGTTLGIAGVALYDAAAGAKVAVAGPGCMCYVVNGIQATNWDAGTYLKAYGTTTAGTVTIAAITGGVAPLDIIGLATDNNTATTAGTASKVLVTCGTITAAA